MQTFFPVQILKLVIYRSLYIGNRVVIIIVDMFPLKSFLTQVIGLSQKLYMWGLIGEQGSVAAC